MFKKKNSFEKRLKESTNIRQTYPDRIPVICERKDKRIPELDKKKYLVPFDLTMGQFSFIIRRRLRLSPEKAIFFHFRETLVPLSTSMNFLYDKCSDEDGFLYVLYSGENVFG